MIVDSKWLQDHGLSYSRIHDYVRAGWLERMGPRIYRRPTRRDDGPDTTLTWALAVTSAQALADNLFHVGGPTALDLLGLSHFLDFGQKSRIWLYDAERVAPPWLSKLNLNADLKLVRRRLFNDPALGVEWRRLDIGSSRVGSVAAIPERKDPWDQFLRIAVVERATLEMLDAVGVEVGFHSADKVFESLASLRPRMLVQLLRECTSVKAKRLFFYFADRHAHGWARRLDATDFDLGTGKRQIVRGGRLDPRYQITVPEDLLPSKDDVHDG